MHNVASNNASQQIDAFGKDDGIDDDHEYEEMPGEEKSSLENINYVKEDSKDFFENSLYFGSPST